MEALESDFVSMTWTCKVCPVPCPGGVHKIEDVKWDVVQEKVRTQHDVREKFEEIIKDLKGEIEQLKREIEKTSVRY